MFCVVLIFVNSMFGVLVWCVCVVVCVLFAAVCCCVVLMIVYNMFGVRGWFLYVLVYVVYGCCVFVCFF